MQRSSWARGLTLMLILLVGCGFIARTAPLLNRDGRLLRQFPGEDGYLMLTIARNIAIGNRMSIAAGTISTNGTQPLCTFLWAGCFWLVDGDKTYGVAMVLVLQLVIACAAAYAVYRLGLSALAGREDAPAISKLAAALWFASSLCVQHTMNCLETGTYTLIVILVAISLVDCFRQQQWTMRRCVALGLLLGLAFWARNDAVLLVLAVCLTRVLVAVGAGRESLLRRFVESVVIGATSLCVALPWPVYNAINFGHIVPISGLSEGMDAVFAGNLGQVAPKLAEFVLVVGAIPSQFEQNSLVLAGSVLLIFVFLGSGTWFWSRSESAVRATAFAITVFAALLASFYGLYFGAGYFMSRYLFPLSPFLALATVAGLWTIVCSIKDCRMRTAAAASLSVMALGMTLALNVRQYVNGSSHMHFQVVEWVSANVPDDAWVGAPQTGTLGFFHDRTINLDGKVNPQALRARGFGGRPNTIPQYIVNKNIQYLADWEGLATWQKLPIINQHYSLVLHDPDRGYNGLAVFKRRLEPQVHKEQSSADPPG